jgi:anti-sigma B factor antagonist
MDLVTSAVGRDGTVAVAVAGELDVLSAPELAAALRDALIRYRPRRVEVDLGEVNFMDSTGIQVLVAANNDAAAAGGGVTVVRASPQVQRVLRLTGLLDALGPADPT